VHVELTDTQRQLRETVRAFAKARVAPAAAEIDRAGRVPREIVAALADLGVMGCIVPERHGGAGVDAVAWALAVEELGAACGSTALVFVAHTGVVWPIVERGTPAQQARWLPSLANATLLGCLALGDARDITARREGDGWVLSGTARSVANGGEAALALVVAEPVGAYVVETASRGWEVARRDRGTGFRGAALAEVALRDVRVPRESVLEESASAAIDGARLGIAALAVGIARAAVEASLAYARERRVFGEPIAAFQGAQWRLADMATAVESARLLTLRAAFLKDRGLPYTSEAAMAKVFAAETAMTLATQAVQMHGGYGYTREFPVERHFRDAAAAATIDGAPAAQRLAIAARLLGEAHA
jgi:butyryl-CoA dehydrogenase